MPPVLFLPHISSALLFSVVLQVGQVAGKGGKGGGGGGKGSGIGDSVSSLDLAPADTALFAILIVIAIWTLSQAFRALGRFKRPVLPPDAPALDYQVGKLFPTFLFAYTLIYLIHSIFYAVQVVSGRSFSHRGLVSNSFPVGTYFIFQLFNTLFVATFLTILAYRQKIQLNPSQPSFNLKSFLDGWLLSVTLILGIATDAILGAAIRDRAISLEIRNMDIAYQSFLILTNVDVVVSSVMAYVRFRKSEIRDKIVDHMIFIVTPFFCILALYRAVYVGLSYSDVWLGVIDPSSLEFADIILPGIVSIIVVEVALRMGALPKPPKNASRSKA